MKLWTVYRTRPFLLFLCCLFPVLFILAVTTLLYPSYIDFNFYSRKSTPPQPYLSTDSTPSELLRPWESPISVGASGAAKGWNFEPSRDERNFGLSDSQCSIAFPGFYREIDRAVSFRQETGLGNLTIEDVDIAWRDVGEILRLMIYDKKLYIVDALWASHGWDVPRALALVQSIHRSVVAYPDAIPNIEFSVCLGDWPGDPSASWPLWVLTRSKKEEEKWVMPDFGYWSWPNDLIGEYTQIRGDIHENEPVWDKKLSRAVWRGATVTNKLRDDLVRVTRGKSWSDVHEIDWQNGTSMEILGLSMPEHCDYQFVIHTEGHSYSGRGKYLLNCQSVSIVHEPEWIEPHTHLYIPSGPNQNIILVNRDFSDLSSNMKMLLGNPKKAKQIADNSARIFRDRYLTPAAQACYWRKLFRAWASISFEPELYETVTDHDGRSRQKLRGTPFETFVAKLVFPKP